MNICAFPHVTAPDQRKTAENKRIPWVMTNWANVAVQYEIEIFFIMTVLHSCGVYIFYSYSCENQCLWWSLKFWGRICQYKVLRIINYTIHVKCYEDDQMKLSTVMNVVSKYVRSDGDGNGYCTTILKFQHYVSFVV